MKEFSKTDFAALDIALPPISKASAHPTPIPMDRGTHAGFDAYDLSDALEAAFAGVVVTGALLFAAFSLHFVMVQIGAGTIGTLVTGACYLAAAVAGALTVTELSRGIARLVRR